MELRSANHQFGQGLVQTQKNNFAPRIGFAYQINPKLVVRGGFGFFFNSFENQGYGPNIGENYPFVFNFTYASQTASSDPGQQVVSPISYNTPWAGCPTAGPGWYCNDRCRSLLRSIYAYCGECPGPWVAGTSIQLHHPTHAQREPTFQYSITRALSAQVAYVFTQGKNLQAGSWQQQCHCNLTARYKHYERCESWCRGNVPFPDFSSNGSFQSTIGLSDYNGLQTKIEQQFSNGLTLLLRLHLFQDALGCGRLAQWR